MTLELLTKQEVEENPAGHGREEPNQNPTLDLPKCVQPLLAYFLFERFQFIYLEKTRKISKFPTICIVRFLWQTTCKFGTISIWLFFFSIFQMFHIVRYLASRLDNVT